MKKLLLILSLAALLPASASLSPAWAQMPTPNQQGVAMGHLHFNTHDLETSKKMWIALGGTPAKKLLDNEVVKIPGVLILLKPQDPTSNGKGSVISHLTFKVPNVAASMAKVKAAGITTEAGQNAQQYFVITPDQMKLEILEEAGMTGPIAIDHIHFAVPEAALSDIQGWYAKMFGAVPGMRADNKSADLPGAKLVFSKTANPPLTSKGTALDHLGFEVGGLEAYTKKLEAGGMKLDRPYMARPELNITIAFITDPWGTYIELNEGLNKW